MDSRSRPAGAFDLKSYTGKPTSSSEDGVNLNLVGKNTPDDKIARINGVYYIAVHGGPRSIIVNGMTMFASDLAEALRTQGGLNYKGESIVLIVCNAGVTIPGLKSFGQELATELNVRVLAANNYVWSRAKDVRS